MVFVINLSIIDNEHYFYEFLDCPRMADVKPVKAGWFNVFRPWTLHGAVIPALIGGAVAFKDDTFCWWIFLMTVACCILLQSAANILNTYGDFVRGTDTEENHTRSPELVTGALSAKKVFIAGMACLGIVALCGLVFIWYIGWGILIFGILGLGGAAMYTIGVSYKYHGLGQVGVFVLMGILMPLGTYYVMSGVLSYEVLLLSLPNAFMITAVLCGNEMRDYYEDRKSNVGTLAGRMSYENGMKLYLIENFIGYPILFVLITFGCVHWFCALAFICLVDAHALYENSRKAPTDAGCNRLLVPMAFKHNWQFGLLLVIGYIVGNCVI